MRTDPSKHIPTSDSTAEQWVTWHRSLKKWFSKNEANEHWLRFWNQRAGAGSGADTHDLRSYMESQGVNITTTVWGDVTDGTMNVVEWGAETFTWARGLIIGGVIVGMGLIAFYVIYSTTKGRTAGEMATDVATIGRGKRLRKMAGKRKALKASQSINSFDGIDFSAGNSMKQIT